MMYKIVENGIQILSKNDFCPRHILECGQIFSYKQTGDNYIVYSADKIAEIFPIEDGYFIKCKNAEYFVNFFDLQTDYSNIKKQLVAEFPFIKPAVEFGCGIRILKQDVFETIISFIVSANNNIKRITKILFAIREKYGTNMGSYFAFPTPNQLAKASIQELKELGAGYRAEYIFQTCRDLIGEDLNAWFDLSPDQLNLRLLRLKGVGPKVADCILLFAFSANYVFPVDTWIEQVYCTYFKPCNNRIQIRKNLTNIFGGLSGYAQQYLFFSQRSGFVSK